MYNKIILVGNLTRDIELRYSASGSALAKSAIATSRKFSSNGERKEEVCFVDITFFGRSGEIANQYLRKGSKILVEGRLMFEQWTDQQGQKRSKHSVTVENMQMLDSKADAQNLGNDYNQAPPYEEPSDMTPSFGGSHSQAPQHMPPHTGGFGAPQGNQSKQPQSAFGSQSRPAQQGGYNAPNAQQRPQNSYQPQQLPEYDIDEDEIPF